MLLHVSEHQNQEPDEHRERKKMPAPPAPPATRRGPARVTLHTRIRQDVDQTLRDIAEENESSLQATLETALIWYFKAFGRWPEDKD